MDGTIIDPIRASAESAAQARAQEAFTLPSELGREDFLRLLIAKLENQDPLNPQEDGEFIAELATFSGLEQQIAMNENIRALSLGQETLINSQALNLIGKKALVDGGATVRVRDGSPDSIVYALPESASNATLTLVSATGQPVAEFSLNTEPGVRHTLDWGETELPDGEYTVQVTAADAAGDPIGVALYQALLIDGVNFNGGGISLLSGDREIPMEMIVEFRSGQN